MINKFDKIKASVARKLIIIFTCALLLLAFSAVGVSAQAGNGAPPSGSPPAGAPPSGSPGGASGSTTNPILTSTCGTATINGSSTETATQDAAQAYDSTTADVSALCVINGASVTVNDATITKSGDTSSSDNSSFYGLNAAVLVGSGSTATVSGGTVTAKAAGANGVFSTGDGTSVTVSDVSIDAEGDGAHAVMATLGGTMTLSNVDMNTTGAHSGAIATDRGGGTITATGGTVTTSGQDSPGIYSTGNITVSDATVSASGAEAAVIEGANSITLTNSKLSSSFADKWGVMIYQSFSGDAQGTEGAFTMTGGSLSYMAESGPLFYVTNSTGTITLKGVDVSVTSGILTQAVANDRWGTSGSNGGNVILVADGQTLKGDMVADKISTLDVTLQNGSVLTGAINADNAAKSVSLTLDATSIWNVTADSHLTVVNDASGISGTTITNITGNGHTVTYDATNAANSALNGQTYTLVSGGTLQPA